jgi:acetyltransferase-like isoleucine patch superfamily enzyme
MLKKVHYLKLLLWRFLPFIRPSWLVVNGKFIVNRNSKLYCCNDTLIKITGNFDICDSILNLESSIIESENLVIKESMLHIISCKIQLQDKAHFYKSNLNLNACTLNTGTNFRLHNIIWNIKQCEIDIGNYFLWENSYKDIVGYDSLNAKLYVGSNTRIQANVYQRDSTLKIGNNSFINKGTQLSCINGVNIGNYVMISYDCIIFDNNSHQLNYLQRRKEIDQGFPNKTLQIKEQTPLSKPINIEDDVWIGTRSMILKGVTLNAKTVVAACTIIHKNTEEATLVYGYPNQYKKIT